MLSAGPGVQINTEVLDNIDRDLLEVLPDGTILVRGVYVYKHNGHVNFSGYHSSSTSIHALGEYSQFPRDAFTLIYNVPKQPQEAYDVDEAAIEVNLNCLLRDAKCNDIPSLQIFNLRKVAFSDLTSYIDSGSKRLLHNTAPAFEGFASRLINDQYFIHNQVGGDKPTTLVVDLDKIGQSNAFYKPAENMDQKRQPNSVNISRKTLKQITITAFFFGLFGGVIFEFIWEFLLIVGLELLGKWTRVEDIFRSPWLILALLPSALGVCLLFSILKWMQNMELLFFGMAAKMERVDEQTMPLCRVFRNFWSVFVGGCVCLGFFEGLGKATQVFENAFAQVLIWRFMFVSIGFGSWSIWEDFFDIYVFKRPVVLTFPSAQDNAVGPMWKIWLAMKWAFTSELGCMDVKRAFWDLLGHFIFGMTFPIANYFAIGALFGAFDENTFFVKWFVGAAGLWIFMFNYFIPVTYLKIIAEQTFS